MMSVGPDLPLATELAVVSARMSGLFLSTATVHTALALITFSAKELIPGQVGSGITLVDSNGVRSSAAATDAAVERADALQYEFDQGPCLAACEMRTSVRIDDTATDTRWTAWANAVIEFGVRSTLSAPLVAGEEALGALKVYAKQPHAYQEREAQLLTMFAAQATILLANMRSHQDAERISDRLKDTFRGRDAITLAKGIIMAREQTDERTAFRLLADTAQHEHKPLREVAERIARSTVRHRR